MTAEQLRQIRELFEAALEREPAARDDFLATACPDEAVRAQVRQMQLDHAQSADFLEAPALIDASLLEDEEHREVAAGRRIGPYEVRRELGRGGMGVVYLAVRADDVYHKQVAIKLVWPGLGGGEVVRRFRQERRILAALDHPHIARLIDGGATEEGWPYLVMEYIDGVPINEYCDQHRLSITARLKLFRTVCSAVQYAHQNLVVHRDLKPSNVLVTSDGTIKLLDFGIAKLLQPDPNAAPVEETRTGLHLMTPEYASPEQVSEGAITTATDIYSLGVMLYELLTGQRPYRFKSRLLHEAVRVICEQEPEPPSAAVSRVVEETGAAGAQPTRQTPESVSATREGKPERLRRRLKGDLDNIALKALRKEPEQRYLSVEQLSEDIRRHLAGEPVVARKDSLGYRARKFIWRHQAEVAAALLLFLALVSGTIIALRRAGAEKEQAREARRQLYESEIKQAAQDWESGDLEGMRELLDHYLKPGEEDWRGFEWYYLWRLCHREQIVLPHPDQVESAHFESDDRVVATKSQGVPRLWDAVTGWEIKQSGQGNLQTFPVPSGVMACQIEGEHAVKVFDLEGRWAPLILHEPEGSIRVIGITVDHQRLMTGDDHGTVKLWDLTTGRELFAFHALENAVNGFFLSRDGRLAAITDQRAVAIWDFAAHRIISSFMEPVPILASMFLPEGQRIFIGSDTLKLREAATGRLLKTLTGDFVAAAIGPEKFATGLRDNTVKVWETATFRELATLRGHQNWMTGGSFSPDQKRLVTGSGDETAKLWDLATYQELATIKGHIGGLTSANYSDDGRKIVTASTDGTARIWDVESLLEPSVLTGHTSEVFSVAFSPDGRRVATASDDHQVKVWDVVRGLLATLTGHTDQVFSAAFSPNGKLLATASNDGTVKLWETETWREVDHFENNDDRKYYRGLRAVAFSPDGRKLAAASHNSTAKLWDLSTHQLLATLSVHTAEVMAISFSPDGSKLATGSWDHTAKLWDLATYTEIATLKGHQGYVWSVPFSPDGRRLATASQDRTVKLWDVATQKELATLKGHVNEVFSVAFSPDGRSLATASKDQTVKLWSAVTGRPLITLKDHKGEVWSAAFSRDGNTLVTGSGDKTARLWRAATKEEVRARTQR